MSSGSARSSGAAAPGGPAPSPAVKRSEEAKRRQATTATAISAQKARGATDSVKLIDEPQDKQASNERRFQVEVGQQQVNKLVFGLNPRAHRARTTKARTHETTTSDTRTGGQVKAEPQVSSSTAATSLEAIETGQTTGQTPAKRTGQVRASKYGNFYKPQDLTSSSSYQSQITSSQTAAASRSTMTKATGDRAANRQATPAAASSKPAGATGAQSVRSSSRSPDRQRRQGQSRRGSFDDDISTIKLESGCYAATSPPSQQETGPMQTAAGDRQQEPVLKTRTQFNILPPPQLSIATTGLGSVVNYAKSRIYDRPVKRILANPPEDTYSILDDRSGQIPASILSGFKPPKQVNVTKAREKWEGGEPFAKCKSRKRLAAQANRKLFPGTWSMTSVVATQQLHLQQALAQSSSSANHRSRPLERDPGVKVLTRGSVLERVQQFEKVPSARGLLSGSPLGSDDEGDDDDSVPYLWSTSAGSAGSSRGSLAGGGSNSLSRSSSSSSNASASSSLGSDGAVAQQAVKLAADKPNGQSSDQSRLKAVPGQTLPASSDTPTSTTQQRKLSLRRRSSLGLRRGSTGSLIPKFYHPNGKPNTYEIEIQKRNIVACFDKFPERKAQLTNGGGAGNVSLGRKQFHQIALACGYSEYFKVPLQRFVQHKLETDPKLAQLPATGSNGAPVDLQQRKSSTVALDTNGTSSTTFSRASLKKAASVESSSPKAAAGRNNAASGQVEADDKKEINFVSCDQFLACWRELLDKAFDQAAQFIHLLTNGQRPFLTPDDFVPLVQSIIDDHPGLKFLRAAPDFHMRYIQTVIARIYFNVNRSWTGKISLQELRKSNLLSVLTKLAQEEDINRIRDYFSYEHFYVIYCKFWNLDQDHDLFISKEDLARHNDAAISSRIIERIFSGIVSKQIQRTNRMSYADFVWFLIAEEDKKHPRSVEYWFRLMDLDGDGFISMYEMEYFYYEQTKRLELMNIEALPFLDSACQILDLVNPRERNKISLADLKRTKMATIFFDTFINLEKYLEHESREFVSTRDIVQNGVVISDWDRYASEEYENLVTEESSV